MPIKECFLSPLKVLQLLIFVAAIAYHHHPVNGLNGPTTRKLDESTTDDQGMKCTPCTQSPPPPRPPPPPSPPPPLPALKKPPTQTQYCPPPPSFIYITGPPGNLYPIDSDFKGASSSKVPGSLPILIACGVFGLLAFW